MSIKLMSKIWENGPPDTNDRFVLLCLADYANDDNECWPSIAGIGRKTCLSDRGVQKILRRLQDAGWLEIQVGGGRKNCNVYLIKTPNDMRGLIEETPNVSAETPNTSAKNPERGSPEPSITPIEPPYRGHSQKKPNRKKPAKAMPEDWTPDIDKARNLMDQLKLTKDEMNYCYQQMKGHAHATDRRQANWDQAFANWIRKAVQSGEVGPRSRSRSIANGRDTAFD